MAYIVFFTWLHTWASDFDPQTGLKWIRCQPGVNLGSLRQGTPPGTATNSMLSCRRSRRILFSTQLPCRRQPQGTVSDSFLSFFSLPAMPQALVSYRKFLSSSFFLSGNTPFSHTSLHPIQTKLGQSDQYLDHYSGSNDDGVRGHDGVTGVKKVIFTKKASSPTECVALTRDLCIWISLTPSTKVITLKIHLGSLGVTGVKRSFSPKRHQVLQDT